jgi:AraC family transcriptional regulator, ethanolamine operon transcriptional activator
MPQLPMDRPVLIESEDTGEISEQFRGWHIELIQLGRGQMHGSGVLVSLDRIRIAGVHFGRAAILRGTAPRGYCSLLSTWPASPPVRVRSRPIGGGACLMLGSRAPVEMYLPENCRAFILSLPSTRAGAEFRSLAAEHSALLSHCMDLIESFRRTDSDVVAAQVQCRLRELLAPAAASLFSQSTPLPPESAENAVRRSAVSRACSYIDAQLRAPITLNDLCDAAGVRARTLEYGFRECYDVGPMTYLRSVRLSRVRRDLLNPKSVAGSVAKAARRWRFTHMGQFSRDYRILFGESPSTTLARSRGLLLQPDEFSAVPGE